MNQDLTRIDIRFDPTQQRMSGIATHGMTPFDVPFISQIDGNLWQGGCETGLVLPEFIKHLISLYPWEQYLVKHELATSLTIKMYDSKEQGFEQVDEIAQQVVACVEKGPTLVHCQAGLNRSSLIAAKALMLRGMSGAGAINLLRDKRSPACLCNKSFERWILAQDKPRRGDV